MTQLDLTSRQRRRLRDQLHATSDARLYRRTLALLEYDRRRPLSDIARLLRVSRQSVYNYWLEGCAQARCQPWALADAGRSGRPVLLREEQEELLRSLLCLSPQELDLPHACWSAPLLRETLELVAGCQVSCRTLRRVLHNLGYVWKRPRYVLTPDPEHEKKRRIQRQIKALPARSVVLAQDETDLLLFPLLRAGWSPRGAPAEVILSGRNARRVIFGAMNLRTGTRLFLARPKGRSRGLPSILGNAALRLPRLALGAAARQKTPATPREPPFRRRRA